MVRPAILAILAVSAVLGAQPVDGVVLPYHQVELCAPVSSQIAEIMVKEGDPVKAGQALARLFSRLEELEMQRTKVLLERHEYETKGSNELYETRVIPEYQARQARIELELARIQYETAVEQVRMRTVSSPFDGVVVERYRDLGETVSPSQRLFRIVDLTRVYIHCALKPEQLPAVAVGRKVQARFPQLEGAPSFQAEVVFLDPCADSAGLYRMKLLMDNPDQKIRGGSRALLEIRKPN